MSKTPLPVKLDKNSSLRIKIIDSCGMACSFCHNEGTPVTVDNLNEAKGSWKSKGQSGRVSIYSQTNGVSFLSTPIKPDEHFRRVLNLLCNALEANELHLTGGEPTLHPNLPQIIREGRNQGFRVCMTSNGENGFNVLPLCAKSGLDRVNFSIFGTTAEELLQVQGEKFLNEQLAELKIQALKKSVSAAINHGIKASANIVVPDINHAPRIFRLLDEYSPKLSVRLLNSLDEGQKSIDAIQVILKELKAKPIARSITAGVSGCRTAYRLPSGRLIYFKQIRRVRLPKTCANCQFNNDADCQEGFYGVRLYKDQYNQYHVGICIQRMDLCMPVDDFIKSDICNEILEFREKEYNELLQTYEGDINGSY